MKKKKKKPILDRVVAGEYLVWRGNRAVGIVRKVGKHWKAKEFSEFSSFDKTTTLGIAATAKAAARLL